MNFLGNSERDRLLGAAYDEPCEPYRIGGAKDSLVVRPFSLGVFRRAMTIGIDSVRSGFAATEDDELRLIADLETLTWLLAAPEEEVLAAMRTNRWKAAIASYLCDPIPFPVLALVRMEVERSLRLVRAAMFGVVKRPPASDAMEKAEEDEQALEPADLLTPGRLAAIALGIHEKTGWTEWYVQERLPLCRFLQYAHGVQWTNPRVWTVEPDGVSVRDDADPLAGLEDVREVREPVEIEF